MKTAKQKLAQENMDLWKEVCLGLWGDRCIISGEEGITFHHFIPKSKNGLMIYDEKNGVPLSKKYHYIIHFSKNPAEVHRVIETIRQKRGKKWCDYIDEHEKIHASSFKTLQWLQDVNKKLINKLKKI